MLVVICAVIGTMFRWAFWGELCKFEAVEDVDKSSSKCYDLYIDDHQCIGGYDDYE